MSIEARNTGWLDRRHHAEVREWLCHTTARYRLICPAYCLMPDRGHFFWIGYCEQSDQRLAAAHFRTAWNSGLRKKGFALDFAGCEHVGRNHTPPAKAFAAAAQYVFDTPVRASLVPEWNAYPYLGAMAPGYPDLDPRDADFWERCWRIYEQLLAEA